MNNETEMVLSVWEKAREYIQPNKRDDAALQILIAITNFLDDVNLEQLVGEDDNIDYAVAAINSDESVAVEIDEDDEYNEWEY